MKQLSNFIKSVETGNMTKAAERLNVSQTALGLQIRNLETMLGVELLVRHSRGITTTEAGRLLFDRGVAIMRLVEEAKRDVSAFRMAALENISIGVTPSIMRLVGADFLVSAMSELPGVSVRLVEELSFVLVDLLLRDEIDLALAYDVTESITSMRTALMKEDLFFITAPGSAFPRGGVQFRDAVASNLALPSDRDNVWRAVHRAAKVSTVPVNVRFTIQSLETIKTLVERGVATSIVPYGVAAEEIARGVIEAHTIEGPELVRTLYLAESPNRMAIQQEGTLRDFIDMLVDTLADRIGPHATVIGRCGSAGQSSAALE
ncbi:LysR family transcriptional regulator [Phyllobacterium bourgognense]|nr:LysR family transcriptional regulator [Phyllobacterium bourgognense]